MEQKRIIGTHQQPKKALVKIEDLYNKEDLEIIKKQDELNILVNQEPKKSWLKHNKLIRDREVIVDGKKTYQKYMYLPIERIEFLLTAIFKKWTVEILQTQTIANSIVVTVRLRYQDPITQDWLFQDGVGASPIITNKGAKATDWNEVQTMSVMKSAPAAESFAIKDAAEKIGRLFGKDTNRDGVDEYAMLETRHANNKEIEAAKLKISKILGESQDEDEKSGYIELITNKEAAGEVTLEFYENIIKTLGNG